MGFASILDSLGWAILHSLWQGALAAGAVMVFRGFTRDSQASLRCGFQVMALFAMLFAFIGTFIYYQIQYIGPSFASSFEGLAGTLQSTHDTTTTTAALPALASASPSLSVDQYIPWIGTLWIVGFILLSLKYSIALYMTQQLRTNGLTAVPADWNRRFRTLVLNAGISRNVAFFISNRVSGPMTLGFFKPMVLVPASFFAGLPADQIESILLHEIAHIRRHDYLINLLQTAIRTVFFYHPAAHYISGRIDDDRERACDDFTVRQTDDPHALVKGLAALRLSLTPRPFAMAAADNKSPIVKRMKRLVRPETRSRKPEHVLTSMVAIIAAAGLYSWYSPIANAHPEIEDGLTEITVQHPSGKLGNYRFKTINDNDWSYTVKVAEDGTEWVNVNGTWHNASKNPEWLKQLPDAPVPPLMPNPEKIRSYVQFKDKASQYRIDLDYYIARLEGLNLSGRGDTANIREKLDKAYAQREKLDNPDFDYKSDLLHPISAPAAPQAPRLTKIASSEPALAGEPPTPPAFPEGGSNWEDWAEDWQNAWEDRMEHIADTYEDEMDSIEDRLEAALDTYDQRLDTIEDWDESQFDQKAIMKSLQEAEKALQKSVEKIETDRLKLNNNFGQDFDKLMQESHSWGPADLSGLDDTIQRSLQHGQKELQRELQHAQREVELAMKDVQREQMSVMREARIEREEVLRDMEEAQRDLEHARREVEYDREQTERERALEEAIRDRRQAREKAEKAREEAFHIKADFEEYRDITLMQLKNDGLISKGSNSATITYKEDEMYVNGRKVSDNLMDTYCELNEGYHIHKGDNAEIKITQKYVKMKNSTFKYGQTKTTEWTFKD